jgi:hypothetical protein
MGHLSPFTEPSAERYSSALFGRLPDEELAEAVALDVNLGEKSAAMELFLGDEGVAGVAGPKEDGVRGPKDDGVSMVVACESGVSGVNSDEFDWN